MCTCAPSEAPRPCPHRYALRDCWKAAQQLTLLGPLLAMALAFDPHVLTLSWGTDRPQETVAATSRSTCEQAAEAIRSGRWLADDPPLAMACRQGNAFPKGWDCIENYNCRSRP